MNNLEKLITNLSNYWEISPEEVVDRLNFMNESEINNIVNKMTKKFKNGGFIDCLRNGGKTYTECKKCGGAVEKAKFGDIVGKIFGNNTPSQTRSRGTRPASSGIFQPDVWKRDNLWFKNNGADVRNHFVGDKLTQYLITSGTYGRPHVVERVITNYDTPEKSDTLITDAQGQTTGHSQAFIDRVNKYLAGAEPYATSGKEVRKINKSNKTGVPSNKCGGPLPRKKINRLKK